MDPSSDMSVSSETDTPASEEADGSPDENISSETKDNTVNTSSKSSKSSTEAVSYTHLDVYKRQDLLFLR